MWSTPQQSSWLHASLAAMEEELRALEESLPERDYTVPALDEGRATIPPPDWDRLASPSRAGARTRFERF